MDERVLQENREKAPSDGDVSPKGDSLILNTAAYKKHSLLMKCVDLSRRYCSRCGAAGTDPTRQSDASAGAVCNFLLLELITSSGRTTFGIYNTLVELLNNQELY